jgi:serine protease inhibitor
MKDPEGAMAITQLRSIIEKANDILPTLKAESQLEAWVQSKISLADDYITTVRDHIKQNADVVDESAHVSEQIIKPTRMEVQKHFDAQTGSPRDRVLSTERALMVSELMVGDDGVVSTYKFNDSP